MELSCLERQALRTDWETLTPNDLGIGMSVNLNEESIAHQDDDTFYTDGLAFYRIVLNAVLYLSSDKAELTAKESPLTYAPRGTFSFVGGIGGVPPM